MRSYERLPMIALTYKEKKFLQKKLEYLKKKLKDLLPMKIRKICFIPARTGSRRFKNKNIQKIKSKPLIYWTLLQAIEANIFDKIVFSSDSLFYWKIIKSNLKKDK